MRAERGSPGDEQYMQVFNVIERMDLLVLHFGAIEEVYVTTFDGS